MNLTFAELECLAQEPLDFTPTEVLETQVQQYQTASVEEIADLLEETQEVYTALRSTLPSKLRQSSEEEIEFFAALQHQHH